MGHRDVGKPCIGNEARVPLYEISAVTLKSGVSGILELFSRAYMSAPSIDEIDFNNGKFVAMPIKTVDGLHEGTCE